MFKCPHCGSTDRFQVVASQDIVVDADEEVLDSDKEPIVYYSHCNYVICKACRRGGDVIDFRHASGQHLISGEPMNFRPFDRVLVRNEDGELWHCRFFEFFDADTQTYHTIGHGGYKQCIPYEGHEALCCMNNRPEED